MKLERVVGLPADRDAVWASVSDVQMIAECVPGVELLGRDEDDNYLGAITFRTGPKAVRFEGRVKFSYDSASYVGTLDAVGADRRQASRAKAQLAFEVSGTSGAVELRLDGDVTFAGALAEFAESGGHYVGEQLMDAFATELERRLATLVSEAPPTEDRAENSVAASTCPGSPPVRDLSDRAIPPLRIKAFMLIYQTLQGFWKRRRKLWRRCDQRRENCP